VKRIFEISLGIVTSVGGFLEVGSLTTSTQAGGQYRFALLWPLLLGTACLVLLVEMSGRLAAVSKHTIAAAMRERFGFAFYVLPLVILVPVSLLVLGAEIGGVCLALQFATGIAFPWWAPLVALLVWVVLWKATFGMIEKGTSLLGLVTVCFVVAAVRLHPPITELARGLLPSLPSHDPSRYWFLAVTILGATLTPYLFYFYSTGAVEDGWDESHVTTNRAVAVIGMGFGGVLSGAVLVVAAMVFAPRGIAVDGYDQMGLLLVDAFGRAGFVLFVASLGIACFGAALEIALATAYMVAQGLGWSWGKNLSPRKAARFSLAYTAAIAIGALLVVVGIDPLKLTNVSMALTAASLPVAILPFLILLNDPQYVRDHPNRRVTNAVVLAIIALAFVLAVVSLPLEMLGG
jgi:Mn2+/Fe2+ NRAMP family transporter